ncbi:MAG: prohibitin family protein, partial [Abditibacteriales bacterium]|nr:prohibitin family protein [Abditibacteriales bacterium]
VQQFPWRAVIGVVCVIVALVVLRQSFIVVHAGERAVIFNVLSGVRQGQLAEGFHFNIPILWVPTKYNIQTLTYTMSGNPSEAHGEVRHLGVGKVGRDGQVPDDSLVALTSDGLPVTLDVSVRFHIDPDNVWRLHREIGPDFIDKVVRPQARSVTRMAFAEFTVVDVYSGKRQQIVQKIQAELSKKFRQNYLILDEVLLRDIRFPDEFQRAIEDKQVAQQEAQRMVFEVQRAEAEKQQKIIEAQGEAEAIRKKADALAQNPQLIQYEYIKRLPPDTKIVVTDNKTVISLGDVFGSTPSAR